MFIGIPYSIKIFREIFEYFRLYFLSKVLIFTPCSFWFSSQSLFCFISNVLSSIDYIASSFVDAYSIVHPYENVPASQSLHYSLYLHFLDVCSTVHPYEKVPASQSLHYSLYFHFLDVDTNHLMRNKGFPIHRHRCIELVVVAATWFLKDSSFPWKIGFP